MGVKYLLIALLILLAACETSLQAIPTSEYIPPFEPEEQISVVKADPCAGVSCPEGQTCKDGECACPTGEKMCKDECINKEDCCTDADCGSGFCKEGLCFEAEECVFGEVLKRGECECGPDMKFCPEQDKCIKRDACCIHSMCGASFERCVPTGWRTRFCIETDEKKQCKSVADNEREEYFDLDPVPLRVKPTDWWSDGSITFSVNNESIRVNEDEKLTHEESNVTIFHEGIEATGGFCKEDAEE